MKPLRTSIAGLMTLVALAALGVMGLREGTPLWASATFTVTILILLGTTASALYRRGAARAFRVGFALFGWFALAWCFGPLPDHPIDPPPTVVGPLLEAIRDRAHPAPEMIPNPKATPMTVSVFRMEPEMIPRPGSLVWPGNAKSFNQTGYSLAVLAFALLGGLWTRRAWALGRTDLDGAATSPRRVGDAPESTHPEGGPG